MEGQKSSYRMDYNVDMVFCIDATGSMSPVINTVKNNALNFYQDVAQAMVKKQKSIHQLRVRVIAFRDYLADGKHAMLVTDFFNLPQQSEDFERCVKGIQAEGGGDEPEDGMEALAYAIKSDWTHEGTKRRNIIVVWSDASTHELGFGKKSKYYPHGMAENFSQLTEWWGDEEHEQYIANSAKRLILFTPDVPGWSDISSNWNNVVHYPSVAGKGLEECTYEEIIDAIYNSF